MFFSKKIDLKDSDNILNENLLLTEMLLQNNQNETLKEIKEILVYLQTSNDLKIYKADNEIKESLQNLQIEFNERKLRELELLIVRRQREYNLSINKNNEDKILIIQSIYLLKEIKVLSKKFPNIMNILDNFIEKIQKLGISTNKKIISFDEQIKNKINDMRMAIFEHILNQSTNYFVNQNEIEYSLSKILEIITKRELTYNQI